MPNIIRCFEKIGVNFKSIIHIDSDTVRSDIDYFLSNNDKIIYFVTLDLKDNIIDLVKELRLFW